MGDSSQTESSNELAIEKGAEDAPFEQVLERLQQVVERLERGDLPLERSLTMFEEGVRLARLGQRRLDEAERRIEVLLADTDTVQTRPLDAEEVP